MNEGRPTRHGPGYYRFLEFCRVSWVYALLVGGAIVFSWPFVWMAATSVKVDRELFGQTLHLWPSRPVPQIRSPYVDTRCFDDVTDARLPVLLPAIERVLQGMDVTWPVEGERAAVIRGVARGVFGRLLATVPRAQWESAGMAAALPAWITAALVDDVLAQMRRSLALGQFRARSYDLVEDQLVAPDAVAATWAVGGSAEARLVQVPSTREPCAQLHYDFSRGDRVELTRTFTTSFPVERLHRLELYLRNDDTWHRLSVVVEKRGRCYESVRVYDLANYSSWGLVTWQEPGPDDRSNKIRSWTLLRDVGPSPVTGPREIRVTLRVTQVGAAGAWWGKIRRNYRGALGYLPFGRYVATSLFLVVLNLVGTLFSCSLVAYSFARLQWPGRHFSFALMLATMMIPGQVTMIPHFLIMRALGWYNTLYPLWVGSLFAGAFNVFLLRQFMKGIPRDLEDAAKIDGCGFWRVYWHLILPLIRPTLAAIGIFTFMGTWNDFMGPLIYLGDQRLYPLALGLYAFNVQAGGSMSMMMAGSLLMTAPVIVIFFFAQKYFIQGITLTGMKG